MSEYRVIDTVAGRDMEPPRCLKGMDSIGKYLLRMGRGQEMNNRRPDKKRKVLI